jgi:hypothetical protein
MTRANTTLAGALPPLVLPTPSPAQAADSPPTLPDATFATLMQALQSPMTTQQDTRGGLSIFPGGGAASQTFRRVLPSPEPWAGPGHLQIGYFDEVPNGQFSANQEPMFLKAILPGQRTPQGHKPANAEVRLSTHPARQGAARNQSEVLFRSPGKGVLSRFTLSPQQVGAIQRVLEEKSRAQPLVQQPATAPVATVPNVSQIVPVSYDDTVPKDEMSPDTLDSSLATQFHEVVEHLAFQMHTSTAQGAVPGSHSPVHRTQATKRHAIAMLDHRWDAASLAKLMQRQPMTQRFDPAERQRMAARAIKASGYQTSMAGDATVQKAEVQLLHALLLSPVDFTDAFHTLHSSHTGRGRALP